MPSSQTIYGIVVMFTLQNAATAADGGQLVLKLFRRIEEGLNPDLEIGRFITEKTDFKNKMSIHLVESVLVVFCPYTFVYCVHSQTT